MNGAIPRTSPGNSIAERNQAQEDLAGEHDMLDTLIESIPDHIYFKDRESRFIRANRALVRVFGLDTQEELLSKTDFDFFTGEHAAEAHADERDLLEGRRAVISKEEKETWPDAHESWVQTTKLPLRGSSGAIVGTFGISRDITERKRMEAALRRSQDCFRIAAESSGDSVYEWDLQTDAITYFGGNQRHLVDAGCTPPKTCKQLLELVHSEDRQRVRSALFRSLSGGERFSEEYRIPGSNGEMRFLADRGAALRDEEGRPYLWVGVSKDITEEKRVERANAELAAIVESADAAIIRLDLDGLITTWNKGAEQIYGYSAEETIGKPMVPMVALEVASEYLSLTGKAFAGESVKHLETIHLTKSGARINVMATLSPILDRGDVVIGIALVVWDVTQVKQLESRLAQAQKLESIGQLAAGVAHEINTPIQYIGDNGRFLHDAFRDLVKYFKVRSDAQREGCKLSAPGDPAAEAMAEMDLEYLESEVPKAIDQLLEGVDHVARIVRALKEFSHPGPLEKMPVDINRAIESTILVSKNEWKYGADLSTDLDLELPPVPCLVGELNQVILNLIVNAAQAIADGNKESGEKGSIHIKTRKQGDCVEIRVTDTGGGIPEPIQSKVFDPFFTTKPVGKGTGQGLAIAHSVIVQKHHGTIRFESKPGIGTTFIIQLPLVCNSELA